MLTSPGEAAVVGGALAQIAQRSLRFRPPRPSPAPATTPAPSAPSSSSSPDTPRPPYVVAEAASLGAPLSVTPHPPCAPQAHRSSPVEAAEAQPVDPPTVSTVAGTPAPARPEPSTTSFSSVPADASAPTPEVAGSPREMPALKTARMPSSRVGRLLHYGSLGAGLAWGAMGAAVSGSTGGGGWMSERNMRRLVDRLSTMRGAALKVGQFLSIQARPEMPGPLEQVLARVQASAHAMPEHQLRGVLERELGPDWISRFVQFDMQPFAAASIGQVHRAVLSADATKDQLGVATEQEAQLLRGKEVAVKVQFPGVRTSIDSDIGYLKWLLTASALLPPGLFLESSLKVLAQELADECDYEREARMCERVRSLVQSDPKGAGLIFTVPRTVPGLSTKDVLTAEFVRGEPLARAAAADGSAKLDQEQRNLLAGHIMRLALLELFAWRTMQTDPNYANFLWDASARRVGLIDFGATREYSQSFMDLWLRLLQAAISGDRAACAHWSRQIGYLTGEESQAMVDAHVDSMVLLGTPFRTPPGAAYDFAAQGQGLTDKVRSNIPLMLRERKTPPPRETYSLNRKLSGAFLLCARLGAQVPCGDVWRDVTRNYVFDPAGAAVHAHATTPTVHRPTGIAAQRGLHSCARPMRPVDRALRAFHTAPQDQGLRLRRLNLSDRWPRVRRSTEAKAPVSDAAKAAKISSGGYDPSLPAATADGGTVPPAVWVRGVKLPRAPAPPGPGDCCMSGCSVCVYDLYADALEEYRSDVREARRKLESLTPPVKRSEWPVAILGLYPPDQAAEDAAARAAAARLTPEQKRKAALDRTIDDMYPTDAIMDPVMKSFYELERSIKHKQVQRHPDAVQDELAGAGAGPRARAPQD